MGQSAVCNHRARYIRSSRYELPVLSNVSVFPTDLGWFGLLGANECVWSLFIGHASADEVRQTVARRGFAADAVEGTGSADWFPELRRRLVAFAQGMRVEFDDCRLATEKMTIFQQRVLAVTRSIPYGETMTYSELASEAGAPRAARAVGNVMAGNRVPILVPCHRVVAAGGRLGGYSAPQGVSLKQQLLDLEAAATAGTTATPIR